jgi:NAD(P)-dependent dehydrogenase (short-subunit alcohol dehydrogenase family)
MENRVVIISGASRGIGAATAMKFAGLGYYVTLVGRNVKDLEHTAAQIMAMYRTETLVCLGDLADLDFVSSVVEQTVMKWGRIDTLINNAAWRTIETMRTMTPEIWDRTMRICITAPAFFSKWAAAAMEERNITGVIINVSSIMSSRPAGNSPAYIASKGAIESLTKELAVTYGRSGIRVVCVNPGFIDTSLSADYVNEAGDNISDRMADHLNALTPLGRPGTPEEVANAICWLSDSNASFISGCTLTIDGGFTQNFNDYSIKKLQFPNEF